MNIYTLILRDLHVLCGKFHKMEIPMLYIYYMIQEKKNEGTFNKNR